MKTDLYQSITDRIVASLEQGVRPWTKPWSGTEMEGRIVLPKRGNGEAYRGINILMLWGAAQERGFRAPSWLTYRQAQAMGGQVRKGETGSMVVFASSLTRTETDSGSGEEQEHRIPFLKSYTVFNVEQIDGLGDAFPLSTEPALQAFARSERAERLFAATGADIRHGGNRAFYQIADDYVQMPPAEAFRDPASYYAVLAHEVTHWTRHESRLDRSFGRKRFGDEGYAMEELVAELGSAFLSAGLDLTPEPREDHASYIENWLRVLKGDKRAIFTAASHAQRAADFLIGRGEEGEAQP
ncbi:zincin-like metallopeptidase domain-containing protein [Lichenihabitans sp. Uapishka_5]|uniref:ArdC family protein n=1 Tax=Lichenihabitans sp. Uapishka_5 TaxID=3037302 RepID=UPI0029E80E08|nr:zincin-like metallopeptidase domain-containing protein [Lichenihabitans sp. Uapishka_5]MDX7951797.1 zincin-like metallopeptidase domain-containing protein [Lichenihabitans sp. Uapishka_5]